MADGNSEHPRGTFCRRTRREFLWEAGGAFTSVALSGLLGNRFFEGQTLGADGSTPFANPLAPKPPHFRPKATAVIFLLVTLLLRSGRLGAVAMVPNLVPIGIFFGLLGLGAAPLSLPTSLVGSIALGIAIDDIQFVKGCE